jgi:hypothetical protein
LRTGLEPTGQNKNQQEGVNDLDVNKRINAFSCLIMGIDQQRSTILTS